MATHNISERSKETKYLLELVMEKIEDGIIDEEISRLDVVPVYGRKFRYLTRISRNNPLLVICQFCILPPDLQLKFPTKIRKKSSKFPMRLMSSEGLSAKSSFKTVNMNIKLGRLRKREAL